MTNREAIAAEIEPYTLSDEGIEKSFLDAAQHFGLEDSEIEDFYEPFNKRIVALASMFCLVRVRSLSSESIGGVSQSFNVSGIEKRIKAIAASAGISPSLALSEDDEVQITYMGNLW